MELALNCIESSFSNLKYTVSCLSSAAIRQWLALDAVWDVAAEHPRVGKNFKCLTHHGRHGGRLASLT